MQPWDILARTTTPDGAELALCRRGEEFAIRVGGQLLMSSRRHGSEEALARVACAGLERRPRPALLIGGLGMGYTLRAALDLLPSDARVVVAELLPAVVEWNRELLAPLAAGPLQDARVEVLVADVRRVLGSSAGAFDAVLLDVDNGPAALTTPANRKLYASNGLASAHRALRPGGALVVWSAAEDPDFLRALANAGFEGRAERVKARTGAGGGRHVLFVGRRLGASFGSTT